MLTVIMIIDFGLDRSNWPLSAGAQIRNFTNV